MDTAALKTFAKEARVDLIHQVGARLKLVLASDSLERREHESAVRDLEMRIDQHGKAVIVEEVAYTWFNRFCALRFMDVNLYNPVGVVSPAEGQIQPEILSEAKRGLVDGKVVSSKTKQKVLDLLNGKLPSKDAQGEVYRLLLVSYCNHLSTIMPFLFERITDYTEILLPPGLLAVNSILAVCRKVLTEGSCKDVEVIGWLYQYYISERKDEVFKSFKNGKKAGPREIPAATQLFTPHWIVRYLVENSLGRLWMLNHPKSRLTERMEYYIKPDQEESDFLRINKPEEIKVCDPACGSGHMLTYAFDLLYAMYEEEGYDPSSIANLILKNNLYGIEIDARAGELAAFALSMKARQKSRKFFNNPVEPNICMLENVQIKPDDLKAYVKHVGIDVFTEDVLATLNQFEEADNFGSLIIPATNNAGTVLQALSQKNMEGEMFLTETHDLVLSALKQAEYLSQRYHVVVANPPYMGGGNMNSCFSDFAKRQYPSSKSDMCTMFIERSLQLAIKKGDIAMITMQSWMFLSSYEKLRETLIRESTITSMAHLGARAFDSIGGEVVSTTAFVIENQYKQGKKGAFVRLVDGGSEKEKLTALKEAIRNPECGWFYRVSADDFQKIPGSPIAYWGNQIIFKLFKDEKALSDVSEKRLGLCTGNNDRFIRFWFEVDYSKIGFNFNSVKSFLSSKYLYVPHNKGGQLRRWAGNKDLVLKFDCKSYKLLSVSCNRLASKSHYFKEALTWSEIGSIFAIRVVPQGYTFNIKGPCIFTEKETKLILMCYLNSNVFRYLLNFISQTISFNGGDIEKVPFVSPVVSENYFHIYAEKLFQIHNQDYDYDECSWGFSVPPILEKQYQTSNLQDTYSLLSSNWSAVVKEIKRLEEENNRIFIEAYGLEDELTPDVPLKEITLTCNPHYRYGDSKSESELEALLVADTMKELISYAVGCMFGRYSLDKPGLILANQGETYSDYCNLVPDSSFPADPDNAIPVLDGDWFSDDIVSRFRKFLRVTFGEERYEENLRFVEAALGKDLRQYFLRDFYNDHVRRYKKRPIYWMFTSPDGSFNVLIYLHRYRPDTVSIVLSEYLREYQVKLSSYMESLRRKEANPDLAKGEKVRALKELDKLSKTQDILSAYERDVLFPLATQKIEIDLDDGVKVNYPKFGTALKKIAGLEAKVEE
ncbi:MAG: BREX-1 system adenine-specific DNA-methyltransferase PglX [Sphaerochaeta sp.]